MTRIIVLCAIFLLPSIACGTDDFIIKQKVVEFDSRYFYGLDGYYAVGEQLRKEREQSTNEELVKLRAQVDLLIELMKNKDCGDNPKPPVNPPTDPPAENPDPEDPQVPGPSDLDKTVYEIFNNHCVDCHGSGAKEGRLQLIDENSGELINYGTARIADIIQRTEKIQLHGKKPMPIGSTGLTDKEILALKDWLYVTSDQELKQK